MALVQHTPTRFCFLDVTVTSDLSELNECVLLTYLPTTKYKMQEQSHMPWKNCSDLFSPKINTSMTSQSTSRKLCNFHWCF